MATKVPLATVAFAPIAAPAIPSNILKPASLHPIVGNAPPVFIERLSLHKICASVLSQSAS